MKKRVIEQLRQHVPGRWVYSGMPHTWTHESGLVIRRYAQFAPKYDGDDDTFSIVYRRQDTGEQVFLFSGMGLSFPLTSPTKVA